MNLGRLERSGFSWNHQTRWMLRHDTSDFLLQNREKLDMEVSFSGPLPGGGLGGLMESSE